MWIEYLQLNIYTDAKRLKTTWRKFFIEYEDFGHTECAIECGISLKLEIEKTAQAFLSILAPVWIMLLTIVTINSLSTILI